MPIPTPPFTTNLPSTARSPFAPPAFATTTPESPWIRSSALLLSVYPLPITTSPFTVIAATWRAVMPPVTAGEDEVCGPGDEALFQVGEMRAADIHQARAIERRHDQLDATTQKGRREVALFVGGNHDQRRR